MTLNFADLELGFCFISISLGLTALFVNNLMLVLSFSFFFGIQYLSRRSADGVCDGGDGRGAAFWVERRENEGLNLNFKLLS